MVCRRLSELVNYSPQPVALTWEPRICLDWSLSQYKVRLSQVLDSHVKAQGLPFKDKGGDESVARKGLGVILPIYIMNLICLKCHWRLPDNVSQLVLTMSWCRIGKRTSSEPIVTQIYDTIWHQKTTMSKQITPGWIKFRKKYSETLINIKILSSTKIRKKMLSAKYHPFCSDFNLLECPFRWA